jgi:glucoside 3-dehydrogenase (cytochrome c) hitch-hiker subunit
MERRELIRFLMATAGLECLDGFMPDALLAFGAHVHERPADGTQSSGVLDPHARRTVAIAAERIIPASDTPGATDADVVTFIDRMLADWYNADERDRFLAGLRELDARCRARHGKTFADCDERDQVAVLTAFDDDVAARRRAGGSNPNDHWFAMLKYTTVFGYCTSEVTMRRTLGSWPRPTRYDGCAPVGVREG